MKICLITNLFPPIQTGTSYYVHQLAHALAEQGDAVLVVTCAPGRQLTDQVEGGVRVLRLPSRGVPRSRLFLGFDRFRLARTPRNVQAARRVVREFAPDVIHACGHLLDLTYLAAQVARAERLPSACSLHTVIHHPGSRVADIALRTFDRTLHRRFAMERFDCLLTLDKVMDEYAARVYPGVPRLSVPWGVSFDFERYRHRPHDGPLGVLSVGHVTEMRSRRALIEAAGLLARDDVPFTVRIIGKVCTDEPMRQVRALGLEDRVMFLGEQPRARVLEELCACDVHAMWITNPGVGSAGVEAMCVGVPAMMWASEDQLGFVRLRHMENALLIDPARPDMIAETLRRLAEHPGLREQIGCNARALAQEHFVWPAIAERMREVYAQVAAIARGRR